MVNWNGATLPLSRVNDKQSLGLQGLEQYWFVADSTIERDRIFPDSANDLDGAWKTVGSF